jgi:hypothetical protein
MMACSWFGGPDFGGALGPLIQNAAAEGLFGPS